MGMTQQRACKSPAGIFLGVCVCVCVCVWSRAGLCKKALREPVRQAATEHASGAWCGCWRCAACQWIGRSIPGRVIRGTGGPSATAFRLTAAMCVCLFSFTSRPLHLRLTMLDLIIRYDARVKIHP